MRELRAVSDMKDVKAASSDARDLEAETAHRIQLLVARTKQWRKGSIQSAVEDPVAEVAAS